MDLSVLFPKLKGNDSNPVDQEVVNAGPFFP